MSLNAGELIWTSIKPILKLALAAAGGLALSHAGILTASASKNLSKVIILLLVPCLLFANMSSSLSLDNLGQLGTVVVVAVIYLIFLFLAGLLLQRTLRLPERFNYGLIAAAMWGNWGDLPLAVVLSVGEHPPFQPGDSVLGVAYVSALIAVFNVTLFPLGGYRLVQRDFRSIPPSLPTKMVEEGTQTHPPSLTGHPTQESQVETVVMTEVAGPSRRVGRASLDSATSEYRTRVNTCTSTADLDQLVHLANLGDRGHDSDDDDDNDQNNPRSLMDRRRSLIEEIGFDTRLRTVKSALSLPELTILPEADAHPSEMEVTSTKPASRKRRWLIAIRHFLLTLCSPVNVAVLLGLLVAFIPALKRLFVQTPDMGDREPPLAFLHETASFIGAGSVPLSIANLGAALAKLELRSIHLPSALSLTVLKLIITPIIAVFALDPLLTDVLGWVSTEEDRALRFVLLLAGCVPTATTCLLLTQMYSPDGNAREIAAALVVQYAAGIPTMVGALYLILSRI